MTVSKQYTFTVNHTLKFDFSQANDMQKGKELGLTSSDPHYINGGTE